MKQVSMAVDCPKCRAKAVMTESLIKIPFFGKTLVSNLKCSKCNFNLNDVSAAEEKNPCRYSVKIESEKDLFIKVVKSSTSIVVFPELGVRIEPTPFSEGYFTNIEGLLNKVEESLSFLAVNGKERSKAKERLVERINEAKKAGFPFTVVLEDPFGNGALLGRKVKRELLSERKVFELKKKMNFLES
jgi:zinc finger protein